MIGVGRWGKNLLRVLDPRCQVVICCNRSDRSIPIWLQQAYPHIRSTLDYGEVLRDQSIQAVVIATPVGTHARLASQALKAGKHVFVEKPLATTLSEAADLVETADKAGRVLFVGHVFLYHPVLDRLRALTRRDPVVRVKMMWRKFGTFEENLLWNLLSHEVSIATALFGEGPEKATVLHSEGIRTTCDVVTAQLAFTKGRSCLIHIDRCSSSTEKVVEVVTASGAVLLWEGEALYKLEESTKRKLVYRSEQEPLAVEVEAFLRSEELGELSLTDGIFGREVVKVVAAIEANYSRSGVPVT